MKRFRVIAAAVAVGLGIALIVAEVGLRLVGFSYPTFLEPDAWTGHRLRAGARGLFQDEGLAEIAISQAGLRDVEHSVDKPAGTLRIAVLGDSYAEALQVPLEATFWKRLEGLLGRCERTAGQRVEVINFGVSGYGTAQQLLALRHRVWPFSPDLVLLAFLTGNDLQDNSRILSGLKTRPFFDEKLNLDLAFRDSRDYRMRDGRAWRLFVAATDHSRVLQLVNRVRSLVQQARTGRRDGAEAGISDGAYLAPRDPAWAQAWAITESLLLQISREVAARGATLFVATLSNAIQVDPDTARREAFRQKLGVDDLFYPDRRIASLMKIHAIPHATLAPDLAAIAASSGTYLHGFANSGLGSGHWNEDGHRNAAELLAPLVCAALPTP